MGDNSVKLQVINNVLHKKYIALNLLNNKDMTIIISDYSGYYESIHTERSLCILFIKLKYFFRGYKVFSFTPMWFVKFVHKYTGKSIYMETNVSFEKYKKDSDQITYWQPWMNFQ